MNEQFEKLLNEIPKIGEAIKSLPESVQSKAFDILVASLNGTIPVTRTGINALNQTPIQPLVDNSDFGGVCTYTNNEFFLTIRDLKAKNAADATKRLIYVTIYSYNRLSAETISRKKILNPILKKWRLDNGNTRKFISEDKGILKVGDTYSLDVHAEQEAMQFVADIKNPELTGTWSPSAVTRRKAKEKGANGD